MVFKKYGTALALIFAIISKIAGQAHEICLR